MTFSRLSLLLLFVALFHLPAWADESLFSNHTVVVVVGMPGDMESEKAFTDDAVHLLNIFNSAKVGPRQVFLLSSLVNFDFKTRYKLNLLPNDRKSFLGLADKLKGETETVDFIIFGHGGNQGTTPVLHVPGPRLTPDEFATVAQGCPSSSWMLFFPGSGYFAKALQAPKRTVLATESDDKHFPGDPIGFGLFLGLLDKETDLGRVADQLGAATDHWYKDRSLARTEEPALWVEEQPPRKLIVAEKEAVETVRETTPAASSEVDNAATNPAPTVTTATASEAWKAIYSVKPADYPKADAVTLSRRESYQLGDDTQVTEDEETFVQILTREGKKYGDFDFSFSPPEEDLSFLACEVRLPDGTIQSLDPDAIHDAALSSIGGYGEAKRKIFSLPHLEPGAILHLHLQRSWKRFPFPHVFEEIPLATEIPTVAFQVTFGLPEKAAFHFRISNHETVAPVITKTGYGSVYTWQFHSIPAIADEPLRPSESTPTLVVTTFPDWSAFATWYSGIIRESNLPSPELEAQARELAAQGKTDREKIAAITRFVTNFRYVAIPLGVNSYRPHAAVNVWQNRYGDCKDKANLLGTMLTAVGYKTNLVLVPRFSQAYEDLPGFAFNHAIAVVHLDKETLWIDSTDDVCRFGLLPPGDPGRKVLVIDGKTDKLTELPQAQARDNRLVLETKVSFADSNGRASKVGITCDTEGYADYLLRASSKALKPDGIVPLLDEAFYPVTGAFEPLQQTTTQAADLEAKFSWKADGSWPGLVSHLPQSNTKLVRLPAWLPREWMIATLPRTTPLHLNQGYPMEISQTWKMQLPTSASNVKLPEIQSDPSKALSWKLSWEVTSPSEVTAKLELALLKADLTLEETRDFQSSCHHLQEALQDGFSYQTP